MTPVTEINSDVENNVFNPFEELQFEDIKKLADLLGVRRLVISDLRDRFIDPETIPPEAIEKILQVVKVSREQLEAHLKSKKTFISSHVFIYPEEGKDPKHPTNHCITWDFATSDERFE